MNSVDFLSNSIQSTQINLNSLNSTGHYENFPVASILLPKRCIPAVKALYRFARTADDIADEGLISPPERLILLNTLLTDLKQYAHSNIPVIRDLTPFIDNQMMPIHYLNDLLTAFIQDVTKDAEYLINPQQPRYQNMDGLVQYCRYSANSVGRLMLNIMNAPYTADSVAMSDHICTSLQLINFWQDVVKDQQAYIARRYIPETVFLHYQSPNLTHYSTQYAEMMHELCEDARQRMRLGFDLLTMLNGRFKAEIAATIAGGWLILNKLKRNDYNVMNQRPTLSLKDLPNGLKLIWQLYNKKDL